MAGISRLQMEAATITPAAKPVRIFCTRGLRDFFIKNTQAAPREVPRNGSKIPLAVIIHILFPPAAFQLPAASRSFSFYDMQLCRDCQSCFLCFIYNSQTAGHTFSQYRRPVFPSPPVPSKFPYLSGNSGRTEIPSRNPGLYTPASSRSWGLPQ